MANSNNTNNADNSNNNSFSTSSTDLEIEDFFNFSATHENPPLPGPTTGSGEAGNEEFRNWLTNELRRAGRLRSASTMERNLEGVDVSENVREPGELSPSSTPIERGPYTPPPSDIPVPRGILRNGNNDRIPVIVNRQQVRFQPTGVNAIPLGRRRAPTPHPNRQQIRHLQQRGPRQQNLHPRQQNRRQNVLSNQRHLHRQFFTPPPMPMYRPNLPSAVPVHFGGPMPLPPPPFAGHFGGPMPLPPPPFAGHFGGPMPLPPPPFAAHFGGPMPVPPPPFAAQFGGLTPLPPQPLPAHFGGPMPWFPPAVPFHFGVPMPPRPFPVCFGAPPPSFAVRFGGPIEMLPPPFFTNVGGQVPLPPSLAATGQNEPPPPYENVTVNNDQQATEPQPIQNEENVNEAGPEEQNPVQMDGVVAEPEGIGAPPNSVTFNNLFHQIGHRCSHICRQYFRQR